VEKVINLENTVTVVAKNSWAAMTGLRALNRQFTDGGSGKISTASIYAHHDALLKSGKPSDESSDGDVAAALAARGVKKHESHYRLSFLHHAPMEPYVLTAHHKDGKLDVWGGLQDPLGVRSAFAKASGLSYDDVTFHPQNIGGGFGRRNVRQAQVIQQIAAIAMQLPYPIKLIWTREADVFSGIFEALSGDPDLEYAMVDATIVKVHRHGHGAKGGLKARL
jgi:isoquinoline 1-oxidoreductase subunit beta